MTKPKRRGRRQQNAARNRPAPSAANSFRIIAGRWRGRRLSFASNAELRPTADRVRETLFNWLQGRIAGAAVLDAFAGSGSLTLEALSRGAAGVTAWDKDPAAVRAIVENTQNLGLSDGQSLQAEAADSLARLQAPAPKAFDIVLLDPPFRRDWWADLFAALASGGWLAGDAVVYLECERELALPPLPGSWEIVRRQSAGQVAGYLISVGGDDG